MGDAIYDGNHDFSSATVTGITGSETFDAIVASSGGDYTTLNAAVTAGATSIFLRDGTTVLTDNVVLPTNCQLVGESMRGPIINVSGYTITTGSNNRLTNFQILTGNDGNTVIIGGTWTILDSIFFTNSQTSFSGEVGLLTDNNVARIRLYVNNCYFDNTPNSGIEYPLLNSIWMQNAGSKYHFYTNIEFGGALGRQLNVFQHAGDHVHLTDVTCINVGKSGFASIDIQGNYCTVANIVLANSDMTFQISGNSNTLSGFTADDSVADITISGDGNTVTNCSMIGDSTLTTSTGIHNKITNCVFQGGVSISGDDTSIVGSTVGATAGGGGNTITVVAGADRVTISGCHVDVDIVDGGTDTDTDYVIY